MCREYKHTNTLLAVIEEQVCGVIGVCCCYQCCSLTFGGGDNLVSRHKRRTNSMRSFLGRSEVRTQGRVIAAGVCRQGRRSELLLLPSLLQSWESRTCIALERLFY